MSPILQMSRSKWFPWMRIFVQYTLSEHWSSSAQTHYLSDYAFVNRPKCSLHGPESVYRQLEYKAIKLQIKVGPVIVLPM